MNDTHWTLFVLTRYIIYDMPVDRKLWDAPTEPKFKYESQQNVFMQIKQFLLTVQIYSTGCIIATI